MAILAVLAGIITGTAGAGAAGASIRAAAMLGGSRPLLTEQGALGRKLALVRLYYMLGEKFTTPAEQSIMSQGSTVLASIDIPGNGPTYAQIAAGAADGAFLAWLGAANAAGAQSGRNVYVDFEHEANASFDQWLGTPAQFAKAWRHLHALAARAGLTRLRWTMILMHYTYYPKADRPTWSFRLGFAADYWPGAGYVDYVASDGYDRGGCKQSGTSGPVQAAETAADIFTYPLRWAEAHRVPLIIAEWGGAFFTSDHLFQVTFIQSMESFLLAHSQVKAALYWDQSYGKCDYSINQNPAAITAMAALGQVTG